MIFLSLPLLHKAEEKAKVNRAAQAERRLRLCKTSCIPQRQQSNHRCSAGVGVHGLLPGSVSSAKDDAEQGCCLLSAPKAAVLCCCSSLLGSLLAPTRHAIYSMAEISSLGEGPYPVPAGDVLKPLCFSISHRPDPKQLACSQL